MRENPMGPDWVLAWFGTITMLRAVGYALCEVDAATDPALKRKQEKWWLDLKRRDEPLFWEFIEADRVHSFKKAFVRVALGVAVTPGQELELSYEMNGGHFAGRDPRDVVGDAIEWWDRELSALGL